MTAVAIAQNWRRCNTRQRRRRKAGGAMGAGGEYGIAFWHGQAAGALWHAAHGKRGRSSAHARTHTRGARRAHARRAISARSCNVTARSLGIVRCERRNGRVCAPIKRHLIAFLDNTGVGSNDGAASLLRPLRAKPYRHLQRHLEHRHVRTACAGGGAA